MAKRLIPPPAFLLLFALRSDGEWEPIGKREDMVALLGLAREFKTTASSTKYAHPLTFRAVRYKKTAGPSPVIA